MMMRRKLTLRGQEKELKWTEIPKEYRQKFRDAEEKQWREHLRFDALEPLGDEQTAWVRANVGAERVLGARWARTCRAGDRESKSSGSASPDSSLQKV